MRTRSARIALIAALVAGGVVLVVESQVVAIIALGATLVLLPAALVIELVRRGNSTRPGGVRALHVVGMFVCGVLVFADNHALAAAALAATIVLLLAIGFAEGHLRAVWWAAVLLGSAIAADVLWHFDWDPFDRADEYESVAQAPFVLIGLPLPMAVIAAGVAGRWLWRQLKHA